MQPSKEPRTLIFLFLMKASRLDQNASMHYLRRQIEECNGDARVWISTT
jgi:hypothetical protein